MTQEFSWRRWVRSAFSTPKSGTCSRSKLRRHRRRLAEPQALEDRSLLSAQTLDFNFGTNGSVITNLQAAGRTEVIHDVVVQVDEKIVVAGSSWNGNNNDFLVGRYLPDGAIDNTFGTGGFVKLDFFGRDDEAWGVALQANGSIIVAGSAGRAIGNIIAYARLTPSGVLDTSFGEASSSTPGKVIRDFGSTSVAYDVAVQPDDKIVLVGDIFDGHRHDAAILRYDTNGLDDYTFSSGFLTYFGGGIESGHSTSYGVALQPDGKIVAAGRAISSSGTYDISVARYLPNGSLDPSFDNDGRALIDIGSTTDVAYGVGINAQGKIIVAGSAGIAGGSVAVAQLNATGSLDSTFSDDGKLTAQIFGAATEARSMFVQPDGKIVVAGSLFQADFNGGPGSREFAAMRFLTNGLPDLTFGSSGTGSAFLTTANDVAYAVAYQGGGNVLLAGAANDNTNLALARMLHTPLTAGNDDSTFGERSGYTYTNFYTTPPSNDSADAITLSLQQTYLVAGRTRRDGHDNLLVASYLQNGTPNPAFGGGDGWTAVNLTGPFGKHDLEVKSITHDSDASNRIYVLAASKFATGEIEEYFICCFDTAGSLVPSWGTNGTVRLSRSQLSASIVGLDVAPGGKVILAGTYYSGQQADYFVARLEGTGAFDSTFAPSGRRTYDFGGHSNRATSLLVAADGSIFVGGSSLYLDPLHPATNHVGAVLKLNASGVRDPSYGSNGLAIVDYAFTSQSTGELKRQDSVVLNLSLNPGGGIYIVGASTPQGFGSQEYPTPGALYIEWSAKLLTSGTMDPTFGAGLADSAIQTPSFTELISFVGFYHTQNVDFGELIQVGFRNDGRVAAINAFGGSGTTSDDADEPPPSEYVFTQFDLDGGPDSTLNQGRELKSSNPINALYIHADGSVAIAGVQYDYASGQEKFLIRRFNSSGRDDESFGVDGEVIGDFTAGTPLQSVANTASSVATFDGNIFAVGPATLSGGDAIGLAKYKSDGRLDSSFGTSGRIVTNFDGYSTYKPSDMAIQTDGKILVVGLQTSVIRPSEKSIFVARFLRTGLPDPAFGTNGLVSTGLMSSGTESGQIQDVTSLVIDSTGRILVGATSSTGSNTNFLLAAYASDGKMDTAFDSTGTAGIKQIDISSSDNLQALTLDGAGRLLFTGSALVSGKKQVAVGRLNRLTGALDTTFSSDGLSTFVLGVSDAVGQDIVVDANDNPVIGGYAFATGNIQRAAFVKVRSEGSIEPIFGTVVRDLVGFNRAGSITSLYLQGDGKIVYTGNYGDQPVVGRLNANGTADTTFSDTTGTNLLLVGNGVTTAREVVPVNDAKVLVVGSTDVLTTDGDPTDFYLYQLLGDGAPKTTITGASGVVGTPINFTITTTDLSSFDLGMGFRYDIDWTGDGITDQSLSGPPVTQVSHTFASPQSNKIRVTATEMINGVPRGFNHSFQRTVQINYRPVADAITTGTVTGAVQPIRLSGNDNNPEVAQNLTFTITEQPTVGTLGAVYKIGSDSYVNYTPPAGYKGPASFKYTVTDDTSAGGTALTSAPATANITVENAGPLVFINNFGAINEGQSITFTGTFTDANPGDTHPKKLWTILTADDRVLATGTGTSITYTPPQSGKYVVIYDVTDNEGAHGEQRREFTVNNVAPVVGINGSINGVVNQPRTFYLSATDVNAFDQADSFTYFINHGDGSSQTVIGTARQAVQHTYAASGTYTVTLQAANAGTSEGSAAVTHTIVITNAGASEGPVGTPQEISSTSLLNPVIAMAADGTYVIAWTELSLNSDRDIFFRRFDAAGSPLTAAVRANASTTDLQDLPAIGMNKDGTFVVVWEHSWNSNAGGSNFKPQLRGRLFNAQGQAQGSELTLATADDYQGYGVGMDGSGNFVVAWSSLDVGGFQFDIHAQRWSSAGVAQGNRIDLTPSTDDTGVFATISVNDSGAFVVGYRAGGNTNLYVHRFDSSGVQQGQRLGVGSSSFDANAGPTVALRNNGEFIVGFGFSSNIYAARFSADGSQIGQLDVGAQNASSERPGLAIEPDGDFIVTWRRNSPGAFFARRYVADGTPAGDAFEVQFSQFASSNQLPVATNGTVTAFVLDSLTQTYASNQKPQTTDIPAVTVQQGTAPTTLNLASYFSDAETAAASLSYSIVSVTGTSGLFASTTINGSKQLVLTYAAGKTGAATVTIRATDAGGATVDTALQVNVIAVLPPTVSADVAFPYGVNFGRIDSGTTQLVLQFNQAMANAGTASHYELRRAGANNLLEAGDAFIPLQAVYDAADQSVTLTFDALVTDVYRLRVKDTLTNGFGNALDGDGNGTAGGDYVRDFVVAPNVPNTQAPNYLLSPHGFIFDMQRAGAGAGQLIQGKNDAFDGALRLVVDGSAFSSNQVLFQEFGVITAPEIYANMQVQRRVTVAPNGNDDFARTIDSFGNFFGNTQSHQATYISNLSGSTTVVTTSDGDAVLETTDTWFMTDDADGSGSPATIQFFRAGTGVNPTSISQTGDNISWTFNLSVPFGETQRISHFTIHGDTRAAAIASANALVTSTGFGGQAALKLDQSERLSIANFVFGTSTVTLDDAGKLTLTDAAAAGTNNQIALGIDTNGNLVVTDAAAQFKSAPARAFVSNGDKTLTLPVSDVFGGATLNGAAGTDALSINGSDLDRLAASGFAFLGGIGTDSLQISGAGFTLDLTALPDDRLTGIEQLDITGSGNNTLTLNQAEVLALSAESKTLVVRRNSGDTVNIGTGWSASTFETISGVVFEVFTQGTATLKIQAVFEIRIQSSNAQTIVEETGTTSTFGVSLTAPPTSNVVVSLTSSDLTEVTVSPATLTFTPANWNTPQTVTATGVNDVIVDDTQTSKITVSVVDASSENRFDAATDQVVNVLTTDNDFAGVVITETSGSTSVAETGTTDGLTVALTAQPTANVVLSISSGDTGEMTVAPATLTFTPANWNVPQTITVTGVTDTQVDGNQTSPLIISVSSTTSTAFAAVSNQVVSVTTIDNNEYDITVNLTGSQQAVVQSASGKVQVLVDNVAVSAYSDLPASRIRNISITGDVGNNLVDLRNVTAAAFTRVGGVIVSVQGGAGNDTLLGSAFGDSLSGDDGNDLLDGAAGNDSLLGGVGNDQLLGAAGDDSLTGGAGVDTISAGAGGSDLLSESALGDLTLTPTQLTSISGGVTEVDTLADIDRAIVFGGSTANVLNASSATFPVTLFGGNGNDLLIGGTLADNIDGQGGNDTVTGNGGPDSLIGGAGNDNLRETIDQDLTLTNTALTASGNTKATVVDNLTAFEIAELSGGVSRNKIDLSGFTASLGTTINGGGQSDTIFGSPGPDVIFTLTGNDSISGLGGADVIVSGNGNDTISGGDGADNLNGQNGNDLVMGDADNDVVVGGAGIDTLNGGAGNDFVAGQTEAGLLSGGEGNDTVQGNTANDTLNGDAGDDRLFGLQGDDVLNGGDGVDSLVGAIGNDSLNGGAGTDTLQGDLGNDTIDGGADFDRINEVLDTNVTIVGITVSTTAFGNDTVVAIERIQISGGAASNRLDARLATVPVFLSGGAGNDTVLGGSKADGIDGGEGDDVVSGGGGSDLIFGGAGFDYWLEKADTNFTITGQAVSSAATGNETVADVERIVLIGGNGANSLNASAASVPVILIGGKGNDTLIGGSQADTLTGGNRNDATVPGGDGIDSLDGGLSSDVLEDDAADAKVVGPGDTTVVDAFATLPNWIDAL